MIPEQSSGEREKTDRCPPRLLVIAAQKKIAFSLSSLLLFISVPVNWPRSTHSLFGEGGERGRYVAKDEEEEDGLMSAEHGKRGRTNKLAVSSSLRPHRRDTCALE